MKPFTFIVAGALIVLNLFTQLGLAQSALDKSVQALQAKKLYTVEDGLSQGYITSLYEDHHGYLWIGTLSGLNRFDGQNFESFIENPRDSFSVKGQYVDQILEDAQNRIWILFNNGSISVFDENKKRFHSVILKGYQEHGERNFLRLFRDQEHLWIRQTIAIGRIKLSDQAEDRATWIAEVDYKTLHHAGAEKPSRIKDLYFDPQGRLWLSSAAAVYIIDEPYHPSDSLAVRSFHLAQFSSSTDHFGLLPLEDELWINTWQGDLIHMQGEVLWQHHHYKPPQERHQGILNLERDANGILWLQGYEEAALFDEQQNRLHLSDFICTALLKSRDGTIWAGTDGYGLYRISPAHSFFTNIGKAGYGIDVGEEIPSGALQRGRNDELLMLKEKVWRFDFDAGQWQPHATWANEFLKGAGRGQIKVYLEDSKGRNWLANRGILYCQETDGRISRYKSPPTAKEELNLFKGLLGIFEDKEQKVWLLNSRLLQGFDEEKQAFTSYPYSIENPPPREDGLNSVLDLQGKLWLATEMGLYLFDKKEHSMLRKRIEVNGVQLQDVAFSALHIDQRDPSKVWVGTKNKGLYIYDRDQDQWSLVNSENGLTNNTIYAIAEDALHRFWLSTNAGLFRFDPSTNSWLNLRQENGIQGNEFNTRSFAQLSQGRLFFGGMKGITGFQPLDLQRQAIDFPILLKRFSYQSLDGDSSRLNNVDKLQKELKLSFAQSRQVEVEFAWLYYNQPKNHHYAYRLNKNSPWIKLGSQNKLSFYNLNPGQYQLEVRATDWLGNVNQSQLVFPFRIAPPWYQSVWAFAAYLLLSLAVLILIFRIREHRKRLEVRAFYNRLEAEHFKEVEQAKSRFFSNITHELKTPLTLIIGPLEQLYDRTKAKADKNLIHTVKKNAADLLYLINQLLDLNKVEQGKMPVKYSRGDLSLFVAEICAKSKHLADSKNIELKVESKPEAIVCNFDSRKVERILINLLSNALKFSPENTEVAVRLSQKKSGINLSVSDQGPGIPPEKLESIFEPFYQVDGTEKRQYGGTGIGLSVVKEYADLLQASVEVSNNPKAGCTFRVVFPLVEAETLEDVDLDIDMSGIGSEASNFAKSEEAEDTGEDQPLILIAEDNEELNDYLKSCLPHYSIMQAYNGLQAWELIQQQVPDLILSDNMMPEMTGVELCAKVKESELTSHIPVIILTAKSAVENRVEGLTAGADDYLAKPFNQEELRVRIANLINLRKALREKYQSGLQSVKSQPKQNSLSARDQAFIEKAEALIEANLDNGDFEVSDFIKELNLSRSQAHRKIKALTNVSVSIFIRSYRLKRAMEMLQSEGLIVKEAAYRVGFNSPNYFSKCFHEQFGIPPTQIRR